MRHPTGTPSKNSEVALHNRLQRRDGTYYLRAKVPERLRSIIGKREIKRSLKTASPKEALALVKVESLAVDRIFAAAEAKLAGSKAVEQKLSREEITWILADYVVKSDHESEEWINEAIENSTPVELRDISMDLAEDAMALDSYTKGSPPTETDDGCDILDNYLQSEGKRWGIEPDTENYRTLLREFRRARVEILNRSIDRLRGRKPVRRDFEEYSARSILPPPPQQQIAFGKYLDEFMEYQRASHAETTPSSYAVPVRVLREVIGEAVPLSSITFHHLKKVLDILRSVPVRMTQRYPGLTCDQAIAAAKRFNDTKTISPRTFKNYYTLIVAVFNFAKDEPYGLRSNPAHARQFREVIKKDRNKKRKEPKLFTSEELTTIFHAPLYTGCVDDGRGYNKVGSNVIRQGRFWVPLIGLFHGLRMNEACQLYTSDIKSDGNIPYFFVRTELDETDENEKRVKNPSSRRKVPIHPELLKMGFVDYVNERIGDVEQARLFPTLNLSKTRGRYSHVFSKWFGRFLQNACGHKPKATFHSFRSHFRIALSKGGVLGEVAKELGGWAHDDVMDEVYFHGEMPELLAAISRVSYPGLDLSHLYFPDANVTLKT